MVTSTNDYRVNLDAYAGPLDLLLHLVKRHEIDLHEIPIAQLTDQYLAHLRAIEVMDMERAGEFLVMAATLLEIKSKLIQPAPETEQSADEAGHGVGEDALQGAGDESGAVDPRYELVQQLLAYKQYKDAANHLEARQQTWAARFQAGAEAPKTRQPDHSDHEDEPANAPQIELELEDVNVMDLCEAFGRLMSSIGRAAGHQVTYDDTPIQLHAEDVADRLRRAGPLTLEQLFEGRSNRSEMIGLFLSTLELVRDKRVRVHQNQAGGTVTLELIPEAEREALAAADEEPADWTDPETGEMQYDWPDEAARRRAEQRKRIREKERLKRMRGERGEDSDEGDTTDVDQVADEVATFGESDSDNGDADDDNDTAGAPPGV